MTTIAVDCGSGVPRRGGDPYEVTLSGVEEFAKHHSFHARFLLCGEKRVVDEFLGSRQWLKDRCEVISAPAVVPMEASIRDGIRSLGGSSMRAAIGLVSDGRADAVISAGNTAVYLSESRRKLGVIEGVQPAFVSRFPTKRSGISPLYLDGGATVVANPTVGLYLDHTRKGVVLAQLLRGISCPRVALLSNGGESHKGVPNLRAAAEQLQAIATRTNQFKYVGFVEGNTIIDDVADVVVTDGWTGNHGLKFSEGTGAYIKGLLKEATRRHPIGGRLLGAAMQLFAGDLRHLLNPDTYNGAVLAGLRGNVIKVHGGSEGRGYTAGLTLAQQCAEVGLSQALHAAVAQAQSECVAVSRVSY